MFSKVVSSSEWLRTSYSLNRTGIFHFVFWYELLEPYKEEIYFFSDCKGIQDLYENQELMKPVIYKNDGCFQYSTNQCLMKDVWEVHTSS